MNINEIQQQLFQLIKTRLPADASVADEVAKLLDISTDSAYRRMRGEKQVTFEEVYILANHFRVSLDQLMGIATGGFLFQGNIVNEKTYTFEQYLTGMLHTMAYFNSFKNKEI
ncbi:MAG TPA: helix-turn-helix domain-containing protein, partial [Chitinophagaceae bacterium]|nr:helix-turn-helix domain-containing protein [Chitinophagaceae bacterium]